MTLDTIVISNIFRSLFIGNGGMSWMWVRQSNRFGWPQLLVRGFRGLQMVLTALPSPNFSTQRKFLVGVEQSLD